MCIIAKCIHRNECSSSSHPNNSHVQARGIKRTTTVSELTPTKLIGDVANMTCDCTNPPDGIVSKSQIYKVYPQQIQMFQKCAAMNTRAWIRAEDNVRIGASTTPTWTDESGPVSAAVRTRASSAPTASDPSTRLFAGATASDSRVPAACLCDRSDQCNATCASQILRYATCQIVQHAMHQMFFFSYERYLDGLGQARSDTDARNTCKHCSQRPQPRAEPRNAEPNPPYIT